MKIHHTAITVLSLEKSVKFYEDVFGLKVENTFEKKDLGAKIIVMSDGEGGRIELFQFKKSGALPENQNNISVQGVKHIAFEFRDVDAIYNKLKNKYECTEAKNGISGRYFFVKDPNNILVEIYKSYK